MMAGLRRNLALTPLSLGLAISLGACGDGPSGPGTPAEVQVTPSLDTLVVTGETIQFTARVVGKKGKVLTGVPVTWSSTAPAVASVGATGLATAVAPGVTRIRATAGGVAGEAYLTVDLMPAQVAKTAGDVQTGVVGKVLDEVLQVRVTDGSGAPIPGLTVAFTVLEGGGFVFPGFPVTDPDGRVSAQWTLGPDAKAPQRVEATAGDLSVEFEAQALWPLPRVLTTSLPSGRLTIAYDHALEATGGSGEVFLWSLPAGILPGGVNLSVDGVLTGVPTEAGSFPVTLQVEDSEGERATQELTLSICSAPTPLAPGESQVLPATGTDGCGFFIPSGEAGDRYRVGIIRTLANRDSDDVLTVTLAVRGIGVTPEPPVPAPWAAPLQPATPFPAPLREALAIADATEAFHLELREEERRLLASLPRGVRPLRSFSERSSVVLAARAAGAPERRLLNFATDGCNAVEGQPAFLLGENEHLAVYQDSLQRTTEPVSAVAVQAMMDYYRDYGKRVIDAYFGGVSDVNGDGQVVVYVAPGIRDGVAGFVRSADLLAPEYCASSNQMEITYLKASFVNGYENGNYQPLGTLVHEIKHISSLYNRIVAGAFHPSWLEEGTAEIATDRASRLALSETGGPGMGEMLTRADIDGFGLSPEGYNTLLRLSRSLRYLASQPNSVTTDPEGAEFMSSSGPQRAHTIYGAGWHFHRWLGDAYGGAATPFADSALFRALNDSTSSAGPGAYPSLVGRSFEELMAEYALAVLVNGTDAPALPRSITSFDFPSAMSSGFVYSSARRPFGDYPWPVTLNAFGPGSVSLETAAYSGRIGESGLRVHDFISNGAGQGAELAAYAPADARIVVVRLR